MLLADYYFHKIVMIQQYPKLSTLLVAVTIYLLYPILIVIGYSIIHDYLFLHRIDHYVIAIYIIYIWQI